MKQYQNFDDLMEEALDLLEKNKDKVFTLSRGEEIFVVLHSSAYNFLIENKGDDFNLNKEEVIH